MSCEIAQCWRCRPPLMQPLHILLLMLLLAAARAAAAAQAVAFSEPHWPGVVAVASNPPLFAIPGFVRTQLPEFTPSRPAYSTMLVWRVQAMPHDSGSGPL